MKRYIIIALIVLAIPVAALIYLDRNVGGLQGDPFAQTYDATCASCHGDDLQGVDGLGPALMGIELHSGDSVSALSELMRDGIAGVEGHAFGEQLTEDQIRSTAIYIGERRVQRLFTDFKTHVPVSIPEGVQSSDLHAFEVEVVTDGLDPLPFSIAPMPDGGFLVTEKMKGLRMISPEGEIGPLIERTPKVYDDSIEMVLVWGHGWLLDVALHPDYENNGWVYLHHTERCDDCLMGKSINRVVRGRIRDNRWEDEEVIWAPGPDYYSIAPDVGAGGRLAFDEQGYLYISVGLKGSSNFDGVQDLSKPWGKIHRVHDDGRLPQDNPFLNIEEAYPTTWTFGHRSPQGLESRPGTGEVWSTEMGPRGGDELNLLKPARNYGWPLYSKGLNYDGKKVNYGEWLDLDYDINDIEQPVVDFTPGPAISSFVFYQGEHFPAWQCHALIGSLRGTELYRVSLDGQEMAEYEILLTRLARIRDIEVGADGNIYLLLEHNDGGQLVRLVPAAAD